ncbi:MAG: glycosyltransferase [Deltaproteobacteria bacterium]|nr:MAG: glycosyltransferase [Deltaproteobacteria bacterium]
MGKKNLSVCIVGNDKAAFLKQCIESCLKLTSQISYLDLESKDNSAEVAETYGIHVVSGPPDQKTSESLREFHKSNWILFLKSDEKVSYESKSKIMKALDKNQTMGYGLVIKTPVSPETLESFRWIKIPGKQNRYSPESLIVPKIEIRLVRRKFFSKALNLMISVSPDDVFSFTSQIFRDIEIDALKDIEKDQQEINQNPSEDLEMKFLRGEVSIDAEDDYGMWELGDRFIGFNVLTKDDYARYYRGLAMGFGSEGMYLAMLNTHMKFGRFNEARDFFDAWHEKWGLFDTPEPYKTGGIIYAYLFEFEKAVSLFHKYLELVPEELAGEVHLLLAKSLLLLGKKDDAVKLFKQFLHLTTDDSDKILVQTIEDIDWKPPRLSLCMIVRDEQVNISRALESLTGIADEIVVVDTGSQDETKDIAMKYNAKIIDIDWKDDFSKARNAGLRHATGDYILCLDADEYIDPRERIKLALLKMILPSSHDVAYRVKIDREDEDEEMSVMLRLPKLLQPDYPIRLIPAREELYFEGAAFENMDKSIIDLGIMITTTDVFKISHSGIDRKWREERKEPAVQKIYDTNPVPEVALKAALFNLKLGRIDMALKWFELAPFDNTRLWMKIITFYCRLGQAKNVVGLIRKALNECPDSLELCLAKAELHFAEEEYETVYETLNPNMEEIEKMMTREDRASAAYLCGMALLETGHLEKGIVLLSDARELDSWSMRYKIGGIYALTIADEWENAILALSDVLKEENLSIMDTIDDFADLGIVFKKLSRHFEISDRIEALEFCQKIFLNITENKITSPETIEKMIHYFDTHDLGKEQV